jgi:hypothetical protein
LITDSIEDYGSELETKLKKEVKQIAEEKESFKTFLNKCNNAKFLLDNGYNQIKSSEETWSNMMKIDNK